MFCFRICDSSLWLNSKQKPKCVTFTFAAHSKTNIRLVLKTYRVCLCFVLLSRPGSDPALLPPGVVLNRVPPGVLEYSWGMWAASWMATRLTAGISRPRLVWPPADMSNRTGSAGGEKSPKCRFWFGRNCSQSSRKRCFAPPRALHGSKTTLPLPRQHHVTGKAVIGCKQGASQDVKL